MTCTVTPIKLLPGAAPRKTPQTCSAASRLQGAGEAADKLLNGFYRESTFAFELTGRKELMILHFSFLRRRQLGIGLAEVSSRDGK